MTLKMNRAADRLRELSGPIYSIRENYSRITVVAPAAAFSYPAAAALTAGALRLQPRLPAGELPPVAESPHALARERVAGELSLVAEAPHALAQERVADELPLVAEAPHALAQKLVAGELSPVAEAPQALAQELVADGLSEEPAA
jgi:hypothetical protein